MAETLYKLPPQEKGLTSDDVKRIFNSMFGTLNVASKMAGSYFQSANFVTGVSGWRFTPSSAEINVSTAILSLDIPDTTTANSFHVESDGDTFWGCTPANFTADNNNATAYILKTGIAKFQNVTLAGNVVLENLSAGSEIAIQPWTYSGAFSVTDADTVAWASGTLTLEDGTTYAITGSNTGNMAAFNYIYFDKSVSTTAFQVSTSFTAGAGKILIATAQNGTSEASYLLMGGSGDHKLNGANIAASSIIASKLSVAQLSAITADLGTITAGTVTGATIQTASSGTRFVMTSTAFQGINSDGDVIFEILISGGDAGDVIMGDDATGQYAKWDDSAGTFNVYGQASKFGGSGADGALSISSGTTTIDLSSATLVVKNYTSISITGTGVLAFSNPNSAGSMVVLKSQGDVTITSSTNPCIDARNIGAAGGTGGVYLNPGTDGTDGKSTLNVAPQNGVGGDAGHLLTTPAVSGGAGGAATTMVIDLTFAFYGSFLPLLIGAGGGGGGGGYVDGMTGGDGGSGGGIMIIQCGGSLNFTGTVSAAGTVGGGGINTGGAGGGGGGGGTFVILYSSQTAISGTISVAGGAGGAGGSGGGSSNRGGGGGGGGGSNTAGANGGGSGSDEGGDGGAGGNGISLLSQNYFF